MHSSEGLFISVDGPSGVGKSDTVRELCQVLADEGKVMHVTCEPSDGPIGKLARELTDTVHGNALACLYAADRYHHLDTEIFAHLDVGEIVITDRYIPSALVMQQLDGLARILHDDGRLQGVVKLPLRTGPRAAARRGGRNGLRRPGTARPST